MAQHVLYGGKGGVGKTTCAAATGVALARRGEAVLVLSTDPAHSLGDAVEADLGGEPTAVTEGLWAAEADPSAGQALYREVVETVAADLRSAGIRLGPDEVAALFAAGFAPGTDEVAALTSFLDAVETGRYDRIVLDTAPTGHTLRLLGLPSVLDTALETADDVRDRVQRLSDSTRQLLFGPAYFALGMGRGDEDDPLAALAGRMDRVGTLLRGEETAFRVVLLPERLAIEESARLLDQLRAFQIPVDRLVVNRVLTDVDESCARCRTRRDSHRDRLAEIRERFDYPASVLPSLATEPRGLDALATLGERLVD